jgi:hypothetical protein
MKNRIYDLSEEEIYEFDNLFDQSLTEDEFFILKAKIELDEIYLHKFKLYRSLRKEVDFNGLAPAALKNRFDKINKRSIRKKRLFRFYLSLSIIFFFTCLGLVLFIGDKGNNSIYNEYKETEAGLPIVMNKSKKDLLDSSMIYFASKNYNKSLILLSRLPVSDTSIYFKGICYEYLNELDLAIDLYTSISNSNNKIFANKSNFRIGLIYLKLNDDRYKSVLESIAKDSLNDYQSHAINIINQSKFKLFP